MGLPRVTLKNIGIIFFIIINYSKNLVKAMLTYLGIQIYFLAVNASVYK